MHDNIKIFVNKPYVENRDAHVPRTISVIRLVAVGAVEVDVAGVVVVATVERVVVLLVFPAPNPNELPEYVSVRSSAIIIKTTASEPIQTFELIP